MKPADLEAAVRLESELFTSASWSLGMLQRELEGPDRAYYVWVGPWPHQPQNAPDNGMNEEILGYAGVWYGNQDAEIMTIGVARRAQRAGVGAALLCALIDTARKHGANRVLLEVRVDNEPAKNMYRKFGFQPMGIRRHYYQPEDVDALTMSLVVEEDHE